MLSQQATAARLEVGN